MRRVLENAGEVIGVSACGGVGNSARIFSAITQLTWQTVQCYEYERGVLDHFILWYSFLSATIRFTILSEDLLAQRIMATTTAVDPANETIDIHNFSQKHVADIETLGHLRLRDAETNRIILIPTPSSDPNDPLNW